MRPHPRLSPERRVSPTRSRRSKHSPIRDMSREAEEGPTPICRCRVLYLGSSVPHITKDGLQGIQEPLKELYPEEGALGAKGIDSWLSVWSNGFLLENVDENRKKVSRFFPIDSLHYCAAVRYVQVPGTSGEKVQRFLPLDSPFARNPNINHPPLFAAILRRTTGIKVLECHVFICKRETAANALVRYFLFLLLLYICFLHTTPPPILLERLFVKLSKIDRGQLLYELKINFCIEKLKNL